MLPSKTKKKMKKYLGNNNPLSQTLMLKLQQVWVWDKIWDKIWELQEETWEQQLAAAWERLQRVEVKCSEKKKLIVLILLLTAAVGCSTIKYMQSDKPIWKKTVFFVGPGH